MRTLSALCAAGLLAVPAHAAQAQSCDDLRADYAAKREKAIMKQFELDLLSQEQNLIARYQDAHGAPFMMSRASELVDKINMGESRANQARIDQDSARDAWQAHCPDG